MRGFALMLAIVLLLPTASPWCPAQEDDVELSPAATIRSIKEAILSVETTLTEARARLSSAGNAVDKSAISGEITTQSARLNELRTQLEEVATGIDLQEFSGQPVEDVKFDEELGNLLQPIVRNLKKLTARPRETENLRTRIDVLSDRKEAAQAATENLERLLAEPENSEHAQSLAGLLDKWRGKRDETVKELQVARYQLEERLKSEDTIYGTLRDWLSDFFQNRGRSALIALVAAVLTFVALRFVHRKIHRLSPVKKRGKRSFTVRLADVLYYLFTVTAAIVAGLLTLYFAGDWMLLGLSLLFLAGIAWASKHSITFFFDQVKLMLNFGSVREGERLTYNGIPWEVRSISIFSDLVNPSLRGGNLKVPIRELIPLVSRAPDEQEFLFPCEEGEWLLLSDGTFGKVVHQSPEWVQLVQLGGSRRNFQTTDFLGLNPQNLSTGFRLNIIFGIDYRHQSICTTKVPQKLREAIHGELVALVGEDQLANLSVEFCAAGPSSLDYAIIADFRGGVASRYQSLHRVIQRLCVDAANAHGWVIPFTQITVHEA